MSSAGPSVLVIGGGVIGCAIAWRLARRGATVTVLERRQPGAGASSAAGGMLSPLGEALEPGPFLDLGLRSLERYAAFVAGVEAESGMDVGYRTEGRLDVALTDDDAAALRERAGLQRAAGHPGAVLEPAALTALEPAITDAALLGLSTDFDHHVDNQRLAQALWIAAQRAGAAVRAGVAAAGVALTGAPGRLRTTGVRTVDGALLRGDAVVVAAGAWSGQLDLPTPLPVRPVRGQIVVLRTVPPLIGRVIRGPGCYLIPRSDGRLLAGATMEEAGFVAHPTAGATRALLECAIRLVPALAEAPVQGFQVGLRPATPDGVPIIGPDPAARGLFHATGHFRNGILLAPETAELVTAMVLDGVEPPAAFSVGRLSVRPPQP